MFNNLPVKDLFLNISYINIEIFTIATGLYSFDYFVHSILCILKRLKV